MADVRGAAGCPRAIAAAAVRAGLAAHEDAEVIEDRIRAAAAAGAATDLW